MALKWLAVDLVSGAVICHLPSVTVGGPLRRTIGRYESQSATLTVTSKTSPSWPNVVAPYQSLWVAYEGAAGSETIKWAGIPTLPSRSLGNTVTVTLATFEAYLDVRYVGTYDAVGRDSNLIVTDLVSQFCGPLTNLPGSFGPPLSTQVVGGAGTAFDRHYTPQSDTTVYSALGDISAQQHGPQWMVTYQWTRNPDRITPVLSVGAKVGNRASAGLNPAVSFNPGMFTDCSYVVDYSKGRGANFVTAVGSGQGSARPQQSSPPNGTPWSQPQRPVVEFRYSPALSIGDIGFLQSHADAALAILNGGMATASFTLATSAAPKLGHDWDLGDDIGYTLYGPTFPTPITGVAQCVSVEVTDTTVKPILYTGVIY